MKTFTTLGKTEPFGIRNEGFSAFFWFIANKWLNKAIDIADQQLHHTDIRKKFLPLSQSTSDSQGARVEGVAALAVTLGYSRQAIYKRQKNDCISRKASSKEAIWRLVSTERKLLPMTRTFKEEFGWEGCYLINRPLT